MIEEITVEIQNAPTIEVTAAILTGPAGIDGTDGTDGIDGTNGEAFQSATAPDPAEHPLWLNTVNLALYQWYGTPPEGVWVNVSHEQTDETSGIVGIVFPAITTDYTATPWADANGIQWIYDLSIPAWARYRVSGGGTALTSYATQIATLPDYPTTFPSDSVNPAIAATSIIKNHPVAIPIRQYFNGFGYYGLGQATPEVVIEAPIAQSYGLIKTATSLAPGAAAFKLPNVITTSQPRRFVGTASSTAIGPGTGTSVLYQDTSGQVLVSMSNNLTGVLAFLEIPMALKCPSNLLGVCGTTISSDTIMLVVANHRNATRKLCVYCHGAGDDCYSLISSPSAASTMDVIADSLQALLNDGYDVLSFNGGAIAANWGNAAALAALNAALSWLEENGLGYSKTVVLGQSMGGLVGLNGLISTAAITHFYGYYPVCDTQAIYTAGMFNAAMETAWGVSGAVAFAAAVASSGLNPMTATLAGYSGKKVRCTGSPSDTVVSTAQHTDALIARISGTAAIATKLTTTGDHGNASNFVPSDLINFYNS